MTKEERLIAALEAEYASLPDKSMFGDDNHKEWYPPTIAYLKCGTLPSFSEIQSNDLLFTAIEDFDTLCNDYDIK